MDGDVGLADLLHPTKVNTASVPSVTSIQNALLALLEWYSPLSGKGQLALMLVYHKAFDLLLWIAVDVRLEEPRIDLQ